jgi:hypothetical protein
MHLRTILLVLCTGMTTPGNMLAQRARGVDVGNTQPDSISVRVYGDTGILTAILEGKSADGALTFRSRILKTFVRRGGQWYLVAMQGTPLP